MLNSDLGDICKDAATTRVEQLNPQITALRGTPMFKPPRLRLRTGTFILDLRTFELQR